MTVCIGAIAPELRRVFLVTDSKLSDGFLASEGRESKIRTLTADGRWLCAFSTQNTESFARLHRRIKATLSRTECPHDLDAVCSAISSAYAEEGQGDDDTTLLIVGFDSMSRPRIMYADAIRQTVQDHLGYCAIGEGWLAALASLATSPDLRRTSDLGLIVYRLCEAKFLTEEFESIGEDTHALTLESDGTITHLYLHDDTIAKARKVWKRRRAWKPATALLRSLTAGTTIDKDGNVLVNERWNQFNAIMSAYHETLRHVYAQRNNGRVSDDEWRRVSVISNKVQNLHDQAHQKLEEWERTHVRQIGIENLLRWLVDQRTDLTQIELNARERGAKR